MNQVRLLNVEIDNLTLRELLESLRLGGFVVTPNVDLMMKLQRDRAFFQAFQAADFRICDSQILMYVARFLGTPFREKICGSDLFPAFYRYYGNDPSMRVFLLGAAAGVAAQAQTRINAKVGREMIVAAHSPSFGFERNVAECAEIIQRINASGATVLAVGLGAPKQELWIAQHRHLLPHVKVFLAIGATINFEAGSVSRAPRWLSAVGLEWLYRLLCEPRRLWKRYLGDAMPFFWRILQQRFGLYHSPWQGQPEANWVDQLNQVKANQVKANQVKANQVKGM
jgi:N-acetylglucosaminyldiphosphoundecaprenol N-acetyl-beta-D-mannosaminyltransferase